MITIIFASLSITTALMAAFVWWAASSVNIDLERATEKGDGTVELESFEYVKPWVMMLHNAMESSGEANRLAALLTATSVILSAVSSLGGALKI